MSVEAMSVEAITAAAGAREIPRDPARQRPGPFRRPPGRGRPGPSPGPHRQVPAPARTGRSLPRPGSGRSPGAGRQGGAR